MSISAPTVEVPFLSKRYIQNPYPYYELIRSQSSIQWLSSLPQPGWFVTGYEEVKAMLTDSRFLVRSPLPRHTNDYVSLKKAQKHMMLYQNREHHKRIRNAFQPSFTQWMIESLRPLIQSVLDDVFHELKKKESFDIVNDLAYPIPSYIIAEMLGIPKENRAKIKEWTYDLLKVIDFTRSSRTLYKGDETIKEMSAFFQAIIESKKGHSQYAFLREAALSANLSEEELLSQFILLLVAGHETTVNLIGNAIYHLLLHHEERMKLIENQNLITSAIEEVLRYESPTQITARYAKEDVQIENITIKRGQQIYLVLGAANRDPKKFKNPEQFIIDRKPNPHLSFGAGRHFCLGSQLARLEAQMTVSRFIQDLSKVEVDESSIKWRRLIGFRALKTFLAHK